MGQDFLGIQSGCYHDTTDLPSAEDQRQVQPNLRLHAHKRLQNGGKVQFKVLKGNLNNNDNGDELNQLMHSYFVANK